jgi:uncharacterized membrane protein (UPF0127 family)
VLFAFSLCLAQAVGLLGCTAGDEGCEEDPQAQVLGERVEISVGNQVRLAEVARTEVEQDRGWRHRRCDREALILLPGGPTEVPVWGCDLVEPIDLAFVSEGEILEVEHAVQPCSPCGSCTVFGAGIVVDAVVEVPAGAIDLAVGMGVDGLPEPGT